jgi:hypothetical protein
MQGPSAHCKGDVIVGNPAVPERLQGRDSAVNVPDPPRWKPDARPGPARSAAAFIWR